MEEKRKQLGYLDILRWTAIAMVVMLHVISGVSDTIAVEMNQGQKIVYETVKNLMTAGVPIFLMISGALFLTPEKKITIERLLKHYVRGILLALLIFGTVFAVMELVMTERTFSLTMVGKGFLMTLSGNTWAHMWYLYELIGLYLITPLLKVVIAYGGKRLLEYGLLLGFCFSSILPFAEQLTGFYLGFTYPFAGIYPISVEKDINVDRLLLDIKEYLPEGPLLYPDDILSDKPERFTVAELIREKVLLLTEEEVPHSIAVTIESMKQSEDNPNYIDIYATIVCERESQKKIKIAKEGRLIKQIKQKAILDIKHFLNHKIHLDLFVKVKKDWRNKTRDLQALGYGKDNY